MLLVFLISKGFKLWEGKWHRHLRPREEAAAGPAVAAPKPAE